MLRLIFASLIAYSFCGDLDGGKAPRLVMNDGHTIHTFGIGNFLGFENNDPNAVQECEVEKAVTLALDAGYRLVDTSSSDHNEDQIGVAVRYSRVPRDNIFIVTKLGVNEQKDVLQSLRRSLQRLNMTYVDLYLIHFPIAVKEDFSGLEVIDYLDTWKSMEEAKRLGLAKSIGISNFNISQIERLLAHCEIKPAVLQIEVNLNLAQSKLLKFAKDNNIAVMAYSPFASLFEKDSGPPPPRLDDPTIRAMGKKHGKTVPQVILRYLILRGVIPTPRACSKRWIEENLNVFDYELNSEEMEILSKFNRDYRSVWPSVWQNHPYYPFESKEEIFQKLFKEGKNSEYF